VQVDPMKPKLKLPGSKRLEQKCDVPLSNIALKFNLCRCTEAAEQGETPGGGDDTAAQKAGRCLLKRVESRVESTGRQFF